MCVACWPSCLPVSWLQAWLRVGGMLRLPQVLDTNSTLQRSVLEDSFHRTRGYPCLVLSPGASSDTCTLYEEHPENWVNGPGIDLMDFHTYTTMPDRTRRSMPGDRFADDIRQIGRLSDERIVAQLAQVRGIGRWTARMFLIFSLGRLDVFPHDDLGVRTAIRNRYGLADLPDKQTAIAIAAPWRPYASVASWYCWRTLDLDRKTDMVARGYPT